VKLEQKDFATSSRFAEEELEKSLNTGHWAK
jgi:hypothetical protein